MNRKLVAGLGLHHIQSRASVCLKMVTWIKMCWCIILPLFRLRWTQYQSIQGANGVVYEPSDLNQLHVCLLRLLSAAARFVSKLRLYLTNWGSLLSRNNTWKLEILLQEFQLVRSLEEVVAVKKAKATSLILREKRFNPHLPTEYDRRVKGSPKPTSW